MTSQKNPGKYNGYPLFSVYLKKNDFRYLKTIGKINTHAKNIRYITMMVEGASDNFTSIADKDMQIIVITNSRLMVPCFNYYPSSEIAFCFVKKRSSISISKSPLTLII